MKKLRALLASLLAGVAVALTGASCEGSGRTPDAASPALPSVFERKMPPLDGATGWINSPPLTVSALRGKVVLVDFWTYTCINWMRTAPWLRTWADKYKDAGLVVIGVHSPEFEFEQDPARVKHFTAAMDLRYPVAIDSRHAIWQAFDNQYWPALYVIDAEGRIRHTQFGETDYDKAEAVFRQLLMDAGAQSLPPITPSVGQGPEAAADWANLKTPETYTGTARTERFASPGGIVGLKRHVYAAPERLHENQWALIGDWTMDRESARSNAGNARVHFRFHARDVHAVMGSAMDGPVRIRVTIDGKPPGDAHGTDIDADGSGIVSEFRMYQLIRQSAPIEGRTVEILFFDRGVALFAFTFG
jgi:thiol-disulfide isomerase/thioredoxin